MSNTILRQLVAGVQPFVPSEWCLSCQGCCRFPQESDAQTPTWSPVEVAWAVQGGAERSWFQPLAEPTSHGVRLVPHGCGGRCPAFDPATHRCGIYAARPLDCRLYPFVVTRDGARLLLALDTKCPYVAQMGPSPGARDYGMYLASLLESPAGQQLLADNPAIAGRPREEIWTVRPLRDPCPETPAPAPKGFHPFHERLEECEQALERAGRPFSAYHRACWWAWQDLMRLWWGAVDGFGCLIAEQAGGYFLALPPLSPSVTRDAIAQAFSLLTTLNRGAGVSRVENVPAPLADACRAWGYRVVEQEREYVHARLALMHTADEDASRARRRGDVIVRPWTAADAEPCLRLYVLWGLKRQAAATESQARAMVRDGYYAHRRWVEGAAPLGIRGVVAERSGMVVGYVLGVALTPETFVVLAEITDLETPGVSALLTQELSHQLPHPWINVMGDAGLPSLSGPKTAAHPQAVRPVYAVTVS